MNRKVYDEKLEQLFPAPTPPPSALSPQRFPGCNLESMKAVRHVLMDNHVKYHIFWNDIKFHNHITHRALAIYAMGGNGSIIEAFYNQDIKVQRPAFTSPQPITEENFVEHLSDENYFEAYTTFFIKSIEEMGAAATLDKFIFSEKYNFEPGRDAATQPEMLCRFVDAVMHPLIHSGHGVEFGLKGMLAEGLALAAVHGVHAPGFLPPSLFVSQSDEDINNLGSGFSSLVLNEHPPSKNLKLAVGKEIRAFTILARVLKDPRLAPKGPRQPYGQYPDALVTHGDKIRQYVRDWTIDLSRPGEIERKMEECIWTASVIYAIGGWRNKVFTGDFFLMHMVTSSSFLPSLIAYLSPRAQVLLLRAYFASAVTWWVARGRPSLNVKSFFESTPTIPNPPSSPGIHAVDPIQAQDMQTPNPFLPLIQSSIVHPSDHLPKIQRAFAHFSSIYGTRPKGYFSGTELDGAEVLDGSLFLRAAVLTANYMGWVREGEEGGAWGLEGFYV